MEYAIVWPKARFGVFLNFRAFGGYFRVVADFGRGPAARGGDPGKTFSVLVQKIYHLGFDEDWVPSPDVSSPELSVC
jgi:hypothetical protein